MLLLSSKKTVFRALYRSFRVLVSSSRARTRSAAIESRLAFVNGLAEPLFLLRPGLELLAFVGDFLMSFGLDVEGGESGAF